jgi:glycosyltransferase involved in cell wall biosynthesis
VSRQVLFYSAWPLNYHNQEAARKAQGLADGGHDVVYVAGVGTRNPGLSNIPKLVDRVSRKVRNRPAALGTVAGVRSASVLVLPPRQFGVVARMNSSWLGRQLQRAVPRWDDAVAWVRWPTPELVEFLYRRPPAAVVYDCVDPYYRSPGLTGRWAAPHERAERALAALAGAIVVPGEVLAERFRAWRASDVRVVPHGVDLFPWSPRDPSRNTAVIGFVGSLDYRIDVRAVRRIAEAHPEWRVRLVGPVQEGFTPTSFADLSNVTVEPPVPYRELGATLCQFDVGLMPYIEGPYYSYRGTNPVKNFELMAAGRPAVAAPSPALLPYADLLYFADSPEEFVRETERALAEDSAELAGRRRACAESNTWDMRNADLRALVDELLSRPRRTTP